MTLQFEGTVATDQLSVVLVLVVPVAASPAGTVGTTEQGATVVTLRGALCAETSNESLAATVK